MKVCLCSIPTTLLPCIRVLFICEITFYILIERAVYNAVVPSHIFFFYHIKLYFSTSSGRYNSLFDFYSLFFFFLRFIRRCILWSPQPLIGSNLSDKHCLVCFMCQNQAVFWLICFCSFLLTGKQEWPLKAHFEDITMHVAYIVLSLNLQTLNVMLHYLIYVYVISYII